VCPGSVPGTPHRAAQLLADTERLLTHQAEANTGLLVLLVRLLAEPAGLLAEPAGLLAEPAGLLAEPAAPRLLGLLLDQRDDRDRQRLLYGLFHGLPDAVVQGTVQRDSDVRVRLLGLPRLLELLLNLLNLLERLLYALHDLQACLLAGLLHRLLYRLRDLLRAGLLQAGLLQADRLAGLLQGLSTGHD
jgi:hypothetical protein